MLHRTSNTPKTLMASLELDLTQTVQQDDLKTVLLFGLDESSNFQGHSKYLGSTQEFQEWMNSDCSATLFIQRPDEFENITPTSYFIALLRESIQRIADTLTLTFFCSLHTESHDESGSSGTAVMLKTMFGQALSALDDSTDAERNPLLSFLGVEDVHNLQTDDYGTYLSSLARLLRIIRQSYNAIFILVDSIDSYEEDREDEVLRFISKIQKLIKLFNKRREKEGGGVLKLLMSASSRSSCFSRSSRSSVILEISEDTDEEGDSFEEFDRRSDDE